MFVMLMPVKSFIGLWRKLFVSANHCLAPVFDSILLQDLTAGITLITILHHVCTTHSSHHSVCNLFNYQRISRKIVSRVGILKDFFEKIFSVSSDAEEDFVC